MAIELNQLLEGLDSETAQKVEQHISEKSKELGAKLFIDGDGQHFVPHARFDEVVNQRDSANTLLAEQKTQLEKLSSQVEEGSKAEATINDLTAKLQAQAELAKKATIENKLHPLVTDSIAPVSDLLGFMDMTKVIVNEDGTVTGLQEQVDSVRQSRSYLFKAKEQEGGGAEPKDPKPSGTGDPGNPGGVGAAGKQPKEIGSFGKQLAQSFANKTAKAEEAPNFFR